MVVLELTDPERDLLLSMLDFWAEGYDEGTQQAEQDPTHESVEEMLACVTGMQDEYAMVQDLRDRLRRVMMPGV